LKAIPTLNVNFTGSGANAVTQIDLQNSTGVSSAINIKSINDGTPNAIIDNIGTDGVAPTNLSVANSGQTAQNVSFLYRDGAAVKGKTDSVALGLSDVNVNNLTVQAGQASAAGVVTLGSDGIETITMNSTGSANSMTTFTAKQLKTLNITGDQGLAMGGNISITNTVGATTTTEATRFVDSLVGTNGTLSAINAAALTGNLDITLGTEFQAQVAGTSGVDTALSVTGGTGNDTIRLVGSTVATNDKIDGGTGTNTLVITGGTTIAAAPAANVVNVQALEVRAGQLGGPDTVSVDANAFNALATIFVRDEGVGAGPTNTSSSEVMTVKLNNLTDAQANAITVAHGTTGNSTINNNTVNVAFKTASTANTAGVTLVDGINTDPVFNMTLGTTSAELVTLTDNDTESNTVNLAADATRTQAGSKVTITSTAADDAGKYMNLDSFGAVAVAAGAVAGYGYATTGAAGNSTSALADASRDKAVATVFKGTAGNGADGAVRMTFENLDATGYTGDVVARFGDLTRADGFSSMSVKGGLGNDTFIFDAIGTTNSGFTSADTVAGGAGTDTLVIDGNTATIPGTPRIDHQASEWDNLTGIDVLRFANNAGVANVGNGTQVANAGGAYYAHIDNEFIGQTDSGNRLTIVNNDGDLTTNTESDLVLDLTGVAQTKYVTFVGANGNGGAGIASNRIVVDNNTAQALNILDGGDTDITAGAVGNNNVYEVRDTANVSISDLSATKNFGLINFTNDQAVAQTLTLTLNNTTVEALVDSNNTAASAATAETLNIVATDGAAAAASILNVNASQVTGFHAINVIGSTIGNDVVTLNANVGGTASTVNLGGGAGDRVNFTGTANGDGVTGGAVGVTINLATGATAFSTGATTTNHSLTANTVEIVDISAMTYDDSAITGGAAAETIIGGAGNDSITGGAGADTITTGTGSDTVVLAAGSMGAVGVNTSADTITDFAQATDTIQFSITGQAGSLVSYANNVAVLGGAAAVVQHIAANTATTLNAATNVVVLDGAFANAAAMITAIGGGTTTLTEATSFTAHSDLVVVWSDGTNSHVSLVDDANAAANAVMLAGDLTATEVATLSGVTSVAGLTAANFSFIA
jgi:hypothetical protein